MGKASKWFRSLLGLNKKSPNEPSPARKPPKKKWSFIKNKENDHNYIYSNDPNKQAIAVAAATAAAAEVAVAAAQAAAEVVRLTSSGRATTPLSSEVWDFEKEDVRSTWHGNERLTSYRSREEWAAVKIQSYFRSYLARRALRALKALVKIQALVRGHIVRKRTTDNVRRVQALLRVQARALARRSLNFVSPNIDNKYIHEGHTTPENSEHVRAYSMEYNRSITLKRNGSRSEDKNFRLQGRANVHRPSEDERSDKILEIDPGIHRTPPKHRRNLFHSSHLSLCSDQYSQSFTTSKDSTTHQPILSPSIYDVQSLSHFKLMQDLEDNCYFTAESSPQFYSATSKDASSRRGPFTQFYSATSKDASSRRGPFTPTKSDSSRSYHSVYSDHRNYMTLTESSRAKMRSLSAPRQRPPQYERTSSARRYPTPTYHSESRLNPQRGSGLHGDISNKVYPGSGYLDKFGMPTM